MTESVAGEWSKVAELWDERNVPANADRLVALLEDIRSRHPPSAPAVEARLRALGRRGPAEPPAAAKARTAADARVEDEPDEDAESRFLVPRGSLRPLSWDEVGGLDEVKREMQVLQFALRNREALEKLGYRPPSVLLTGPPGTGKTLCAEALAYNTPGARFYCIRGSEVMSMYLGEAERRIRELFRAARRGAPSIVFCDEIDSIAGARGENVDADRVLSTLLAEMDGLGRLPGVVVLASTNRPEALDPAIRRPGRFTREVRLGYPDARARRQIWNVHAARRPLADDVDADLFVEKLLAGCGGSQIQGMFDNAMTFMLTEDADLLSAQAPVPPERLAGLKVAHRHLMAGLRAVKAQMRSANARDADDGEAPPAPTEPMPARPQPAA